MRRIFALLIASVFYVQSYSQCADSLSIYGFIYNNTYYEVVKELKNWQDAADCAVERGGYLVEINDLNEQIAVYDAIINGAGVSPTYTSVANGGGIAYVWIGATDQAAEGVWLWDGNSDGIGIHFWSGQGDNGAGDGVSEGSSYFNWGGTSTGTPKEPDNYGTGQHHAAIGLAGWPSGTTMLGVAGEWNDIVGTSLLYFIIEIESGTGFQQQESVGGINIFPNPATDMLTIEGVSQDAEIELYDAKGLFVAEFQHHVLDISFLSQGVYYIKIIERNTVLFEKVIVKK